MDWLQEEEKYLKIAWGTKTRDEMLKVLKHRTWRAIRSKATDLKLKRPKGGDKDIISNISIEEYRKGLRKVLEI